MALSSNYDSIEVAWVVLRDLMKECRYPESIEAGVEMALREALANAIRHGNGLDCPEPVLVEYNLGSSNLVIEVRDSGSGFDAGNIPDPGSEENVLLDCGRGIFFMRQFMDEVEFSSGGEGTLVTMRRITKGVRNENTDQRHG